MKELTKKPSPDYIKKILRCDREGNLYWRYRKDRNDSWNTRYSEKVAGTIITPNKGGEYKRVEVNIDYQRIKAHHIVWLLNTGNWPTQELDHIDLNPLNNCYSNLRLSTPMEQGKNRNKQKNNTSGIIGVHFVSRLGKYAAKIRIDGKNKFLGYGTLEECTELRRFAELKR